MSTLAALMVLVACHAENASCMQEPVAVVSFESRAACQTALPEEIRKAQKLTSLIYGDCIPVQPELLAGRAPIRRSIEPDKLTALMQPSTSAVEAQALALTEKDRVPIPLDRY